MKPRKLHAYLSGGMEYARNEGADWRRQMKTWIEESLGHAVFNPNDESKKYLAKKFPNGDFRKLKFEDMESFRKLVRGIVDLDSREIAYNSDYVVCYWDESAMKGAGTKGELTIAKFFRKPVYMVTAMSHEDIPGWILGCTTKIFKSFEELKKFLLRQHKVP